MPRTLTALLLAVTAAACSELQQPVGVPVEAPVPSMSAADQLQDVIVVFNPGVADPAATAQSLVAAGGGRLGHVYETALRGFSASLPPQAIQAIQNNPNVEYVEVDGVVTASAEQPGATWGIDRIDSRTGTNGTYTYDYDGTGVTVYVIDTGIRITHADFGGRASYGPDFVDDDNVSADCQGHGTHVAGTVGSATYGVAKDVNLVAIRVLNCQGSGSYSDVIAAIDYVTQQNGRRVANMSLSGPTSNSVNTALNNSVANGVVHAVAAGNDSHDACLNSPASASQALTAGSSTSSDARSGFSNFGTCVDLFAPGSSILSTDFSSDVATSIKSGTSMASPHVAGAAALYLEQFPGASATDVNAAITGDATSGALSGIGSGSPNLLLYSLFGAGPPDPPDPTNVDIESHVVVLDQNKGNRGRGISTVRVVDVDTQNGVEGVTVSGDWSGDFSGPASAVTDATGTATLQTSRIRGASSFTFCVDGLSGSNINSVADLPDCASSTSDPPDPEPEPSVPSGLTVEFKDKGKWKATLNWVGGAETVVIYRNGGPVETVANTGSYKDTIQGSSYQVCNPGPSGECTAQVP